jgi:general secretion pathway protein L
MLIVRPAPGTATSSEWLWAQSRDGQALTAHGQDPAALLPHDPDVVLVLPAPLVSWHPVTLPRVGTARLRQALDGLLEDRLLADPATLHLAVQAGLQPGQTGWVAACERQTVAAWLAQLQGAGRPVGRIVPEAAPQPQALLQALGSADDAWCVASGPRGVLALPLNTSSTASAPGTPTALAWALAGTESPRLSDPGCAAQAEAVLGQTFDVQPVGQRLLHCSQGPWNLAQFDLSLSAHARRSQRLGQVLRQLWHGAAWAPARWGAVVLGASLLAGLNLHAWQESRRLQAKEQQVRQTLTDTFPHVTLVLDAPLQMQRELDALQRTRGGVTRNDLEWVLQDLALAAPSPEARPVALELAPGQLRFTPPAGLDPATQQAWQNGLRLRGWRVQASPPHWVLSPIPAAP